MYYRYLFANPGFHADLYSDYLDVELRQCRDEGRDVEQYAQVCAAVAKLPQSEAREKMADALYEAMAFAPLRADYPYQEPDGLEEIMAARPAKRRAFAMPQAELQSKVEGAWLGRICGCLLGKPVEGMRTPDMHELLQNSGNFPLRRYMTSGDLQKTPRLVEKWKKRVWIDCLLNGWDGYAAAIPEEPCAPADDDTNYTILAAKCIVGEHGRDFTPGDVAQAWADYQPGRAYCTAERRTFLNYMAGLRPPMTAVYHNPEREYIGAQIRADYFGYINPGNPEAAARMAWRDASISHVKNGIYGEMFVAAMIAAAAVSGDMETVIEAGLDQIPANCRLSHAVRAVMNDWKTGVSEDECFRHIALRWDETQLYDWVHTISNAEIVTAALLYANRDYSHAICRAVQAGFDTDCNGATVGSVLGMMLGKDGIDQAWTAPICGRVNTSIFGVGCVTVEELVTLTMGHMPR